MSEAREMAERIKAMHSASVSKLLYNMLGDNDLGRVRVVTHRWKEYVVEVRRSKDFSQMALAASKKHDGVMEKAMVKWGGDNDVLLLQTVCHVWAQDVIKQREADAQAAREAEQEYMKQQHDNKMKWVLLKMDGESESFLRSFWFGAWHDLIESEKKLASSSEAVRQAERFRELHRSDVRKLMFRMCEGDDKTAAHVAFGCWREQTSVSKAERHYSEHLAGSKGKDDNVMAKAMLKWGESDNNVVLATIVHTWSYEIIKEKERDAKAWQAAEQQRIKEIHDNKMKYVLVKMESENGEFLKEFWFRAWRDIVEEKKRLKNLGNLDDASARAEWLKEMHSADVSKVMMKMVSGDQAAVQHVVLSRWREAVVEETKALHMTATKAKHEHVLEASLMKWGEDNKVLLLHTIMHGWTTEIAEKRELEQEALRVAERQRAKEDHDNKMKYVLFNMDSESKGMQLAICFSNWQTCMEDEKRLASADELTRTAERFREMHQKDVRMLSYRLISSNDTMNLHVAYQGWRELKETAKVVHKQGKSNHVLDKAMLKWADSDKELMLHTIVRAWTDDVANEREMNRRAVLLAEQQMIKEAHDRKMKYVLFKMEGGDNDFCKHFFFNAWRDVLEEDKRLHSKDGDVAAQAARLKAMHSTSVRGILGKMADGDNVMIMSSVYGCWSEYARDAKKTLEYDKTVAHREAKHAHVVEQALLKWDSGSTVLLLHTVMRTWWEDIVAERELQAQAEKLAEQQVLKEAHDNKMKYVLLKWDDNDKNFCKECWFGIWRDLVQDKKRLGSGSELQRQVELFKQMHSTDVRKLMYKLASADQTTAGHVAFCGWHELVQAEGALRRTADHIAGLQGKNNHVMDKALMKWGDSDKQLLLHTVMRAWWEDILSKRELEVEAEKLAEKQRIKEEHDNKMKWTLLKMEGANDDFIKQFWFHAWRDVYEEAKRRSSMGDVERRALEIREMRRGDVSKVMLKMAENNDAIRFHLAFSRWFDYADHEKKVRHVSDKLGSAVEKHDRTLDKALMKWGEGDSILLQHTMFRAWADDVAQEMEMDLRAAQLAQEQRLKEAHDQKMKWTLMKMESGNKAFLLQCTHESWHDYIVENKRTAAMSETERRAELFREMHRKDVRRLAYQLVASDKVGVVHVVWAAWREIVSDEKKMSHFNEHMASIHDKNGTVMDKALMKWGEGDRVLLLATISHEWYKYAHNQHFISPEAKAAYAAERARMNMIRHEHLGFALMKMEGGNTDATKSICLGGWRELVSTLKQENALRVSREQAERLRQMHKNDVRRLSNELISNQDGTKLHMLYAGWRQLMLDGAGQRSLREQLRQAQLRNEKCMDKTILCWSQGDKGPLLHIALRSWLLNVVNAKRMQMMEFSQQQRALLASSTKVVAGHGNEGAKKVLGRMAMETDFSTKQVIFAQWLQEAQKEALMNKHSAQMSQFQKQRQRVMDKSLLKWSENDVQALRHTCLILWSKIVLSEREARKASSYDDQSAVIHAKLKRKHHHNFDSTVMKWVESDAKALRHTTLVVWQHIVISARDAKAQAAMIANGEVEAYSAALEDRFAIQMLDFEQNCARTSEESKLLGKTTDDIQEQTRLQGYQIEDLQREFELLQTCMVASQLHSQESLMLGDVAAQIEEQCSFHGYQLEDLERELALLQDRVGGPDVHA